MSRAVVQSASDSYVAVNDYQYEEGADPQLMIHRVSDGSLARTISYKDTDSAKEPRLVGDSIVQLSESVHHGGIDTLTTTNVESGDEDVLSFPNGSVVGFGEDWVLTCRTVDSTNDCRIRLTTSAGVDTLIGLSVNYSAKVSSVDYGPHRVVVADATGDQWAIDTVTGAKTALSYPSARVVGGARVYWLEPAVGVDANRLHWTKRDGTGAGSVIIDAPSYENDIRSYGGRVALLRVPEDGDAGHQELRPINLTTGALEPAVARSIGSMRALSDGSEVMALGDTATGRIAVVNDGSALRTLFQLAPTYQRLDGLRFSAGKLASTWATSNEDQTIHFAEAATPGQWTTSGPGGLTPPAVDKNASGFFDFSSNTVLSDMSGRSGRSERTYQLTHPAGSRALTSWYGPPVLGRGAVLVSRNASGGGFVSAIEVQDAASGVLKATLPGSAKFALDRSWVWHTSNGGTVINGKDTATGQTRTRSFTPGCATSMKVISSWALVSCDRDAYVVDLSTEEAPWKMPLDSNNKYPALGGTFVSWVHYPGNGFDKVPEIKVASLAEGNETRAYGPARGLSFPPGPTVVPDDTGAAQLAYADPHGQPRLLDLSWTDTEPGWTDTTAPTLTSSALSASILATPTSAAKVSFAGKDDVSAVRFDVDYRTYTPASGYGTWVSPAAWDAVSASSVSRAVSSGTTTCFRVRAIDDAGNQSSWGSSLCASSPRDDRSLKAHGSVTRASSSKAMSRTESVLRKKNASLTRSGQRFRQVYVMAYRGKNEGNIKVYVGKTYLGSINLKSSHSGYARFSVKSSKERVGEIRLVSGSSKRARIDAVAFRP